MSVPEAKVRVCTWNVLAGSLEQAPVHGDAVAPELLLPARLPLAVAELKRIDADVVCLQECNHFEELWLPELRALGYEGRWASKFGGAAKPTDGCAILWRASGGWRLEGWGTLNYADSSQVACWAKLQSTSGVCFGVATTHLKAFPDQHEKRAHQVRQLLASLPDFISMICGDFNAKAGERACNQMERHRWVDAFGHVRRMVPGAIPWSFWACIGRERREIVDCIDYIWMRHGIEVRGWLAEPPLHRGSGGWPRAGVYPSDHLAMAVDVCPPLV